MSNPQASTTSANAPQPNGYMCDACKRTHYGEPFGAVGPSLRYCEPAITHFLSTGVIVRDPRVSTGSPYYQLAKSR